MLIDNRGCCVQVLGDFAFWDYNDPLNLPLPLQHSFKVLIADPPYLVSINCCLANQCRILQTIDKCKRKLCIIATSLEQYNICIFRQLFMWHGRLQLLFSHKMGGGVHKRTEIYLYDYKWGLHNHIFSKEFMNSHPSSSHFEALTAFCVSGNFNQWITNMSPNNYTMSFCPSNLASWPLCLLIAEPSIWF